jgi:hypothetical protein
MSNRPGDPRFHALLKEIADLHDKKQQDYGTSGDPLANIRGSEQWGIPSWVGAMVRANDKVKRLQKLAKEGSLANEAARDSFMDLAVYALLALILFEEKALETITKENDLRLGVVSGKPGSIVEADPDIFK